MSKQVDQIYQSFLVRCWLIPPATTDESPAWRFELQEVSADSQKHRFSDVEQLNGFISEKLETLTAKNNHGSAIKQQNKGDTV